MPEQRDFIKALGLSTGPGTLQEMSGSVSLGSVKVDGDAATAIFVGRMGRVQVGVAAATETPQCVENDDAHTGSPIFTVHLSHVEGAHWYATLPVPTPTT